MKPTNKARPAQKTQKLFIEDLGKVQGGFFLTTLAIGEEDCPTTWFFWEEDGGDVTTLAIGEEDGTGGGDVTTKALGEESD